MAVRDLFGGPPWPPGQTVVVTGAAGCVGSCAGQLCKLWGADKVVGVCGRADKCDAAVRKHGFDACVNYKEGSRADGGSGADGSEGVAGEEDLGLGSSESDRLAAQLAAHCGGGVHCFLDCTGGPAAACVKALMVDGGRVAKVGNLGGADGSDHDERLAIKVLL